jgi:hypothetical protein
LEPGEIPKGFSEFIDEIPDEFLQGLQFSFTPWQHDPTTTTKYKDPDTGEVVSQSKMTREELAAECWKKLHENPQVNTAVRGKAGRLAGFGFETTSGRRDIQEVIEDIETDPRNRLYNFWPKYVSRANVEGELFLSLTCHTKGFIEVDFVDPNHICEGGDDDTGIIFHPQKTVMPLFYNIKRNDLGGKWGTAYKDVVYDQVPSIFIAHYPELVQVAAKHVDYDRRKQQLSRDLKKVFKPLGGYNRFIIAWDKSFITRRAVSYLRTTLEWLNHYENLKKYEIDHKKSSGAYLWVIRIVEPRAYKLWLRMSDDNKKKTGIMAKKTPGGTMILPPGVELECVNPQLSPIKDQDTDILQMVTSGLDEPSDVTTGSSTGTFASVKASRGPMTDRISDEVAYFERFLRHDFWGSIFYLKSVLTNFPRTVVVEEAVDFEPAKSDDEEGKPIFDKVKKKAEMLVDISFPISEILEMEARARAVLGVKHGPVAETLGIPNKTVASYLGIGGYARQRLRKATEDRKYPELLYNVDAESLQETIEGEPKKTAGKKPAPKKKPVK